MRKTFSTPLSSALALLMFLLPFTLSAQLDGLGMIVQLKTTDGNISFVQGSCGYGIPNPDLTWGGTVEEDICGVAKWAKDSLACAPLSNSLAGNIALVRRKTCNFSLKAYHAQLAGAKAVIILNHFDNATETDCTIFLMNAGDSATAVTIPAIFASRQMANKIEEVYKNGSLKEICFVLPTLKNPTADFSYATPVSQRDQLGLMTVQYSNRDKAVQTNVVFKADVVDPSGAVTSFTTIVDTMPANTTDTLINFDEYAMPDLLGKYRVVYSTNKYTQPKDTVVREFMQTKYTYASDNLKPNGSIGPDDTQFLNAGFKYQTGGMVVTGPKGLTAEYASFGMGNASTIAVGDPAADIVNVLLYDNDANDDGQTDLDAGFADLFPIAFADYQFSNEKADSLVYVKLESLAGEPEVALKPDHFYMISLLYDGNAAGTGKSLSFTRSAQVYYPQFSGIGLHTPLVLDNLYSGWNGATIVNRLHEKGFTYNPINDPQLISSTKQPRLAETKYKLLPNPANEIVRLSLELADVNKSVAATLIDFQGRAVDTQIARNFQAGQITFDASRLPSGAYTLWIRSSEEGSTMAKLMICH
ncbi:MAG TPA: hypothetical protein PK971_12720 [Saprospiraceae bacterium]|nr:hypothetical protein [Saprospiraceae bacterium]HND89189.1 hypothetical protein [Saprospiraceae bacterium]